MALGDQFFFDEFMSMGDYVAGWATTDDIKVAILDNTLAPAVGDTTPGLADYTEVGAAGSYTAGGTSIGTWAAVWSQAAGAGKMDSATNPTWAKDASNDVDAHWALIYNDTQVGKPAIGYIDLAGPVDMTAGALTLNWNAAGIATYVKA